MALVQPYDPQAGAHLESIAERTAERVALLLQRKADRADAFREVAASDGDERAFKSAEALDREVLLIVELIQDYKQLLQQQRADNESAWAMVELQDRRCAALKRFALLCKDEAEASNRQFFQLHRAFTAYVERQKAA